MGINPILLQDIRPTASLVAQMIHGMSLMQISTNPILLQDISPTASLVAQMILQTTAFQFEKLCWLYNHIQNAEQNLT